MTVEKITNGDSLTLKVEGRVDTTNAKEFEVNITNSLDGVKELIMDFESLEYISSAGLRVILMVIKTMKKQGSMSVINANEMVKEIFEVTGFSDLMEVK